MLLTFTIVLYLQVCGATFSKPYCYLLNKQAFHNMCYDLTESVGSREHWLWDITRKRNEFLLFSIVLKILQLLVTLEPLIWFRWDFHLSMNTSIKYKNWKCHKFDFRRNLFRFHNIKINTFLALFLVDIIQSNETVLQVQISDINDMLPSFTLPGYMDTLGRKYYIGVADDALYDSQVAYIQVIIIIIIRLH